MIASACTGFVNLKGWGFHLAYADVGHFSSSRCDLAIISRMAVIYNSSAQLPSGDPASCLLCTNSTMLK